MARALPLRLLFALLCVCVLLIEGCGPNGSKTTLGTQSTSSGTPPSILRGSAFGGQQPIKGALVQLWAAGTGGNGSAATQLLSGAVYSGANGQFNITSMYVCPTPSTLVYITASGGDPGLGVDNSGILMMSALGPCGNLANLSYITLNEVTTVGAAFALASYMESYDHVGANGTSLAGLTAAFGTANQLVDTTTGTAVGPDMPAGYGVDTQMMYTLGNILAACVNSYSTSSVCQTLYTQTGSSGAGANILQAVRGIALGVPVDTQLLFQQIVANAPFAGGYTQAPSSFVVKVKPKLSKPTFSPAGGTFSGSQTVTLLHETTGAVIHYTTDGSTPSEASTAYSTPFTVTARTTVKAIAVAYNYLDSDVASATFSPGGATTGNSIVAVATPLKYNGQVLPGVLGPTMAFDGNGALYITNFMQCVYKLERNGVVTRTKQSPYTAFVTSDVQGSVYGSDGGEVWKVSPSGIASRFDFGSVPAPSQPSSIAMDAAGYLYQSSNSFVQQFRPAGRDYGAGFAIPYQSKNYTFVSNAAGDLYGQGYKAAASTAQASRPAQAFWGGGATPITATTKDVPALSLRLSGVCGEMDNWSICDPIAVDAQGNIYITDLHYDLGGFADLGGREHNATTFVVRITPAGLATTVATIPPQCGVVVALAVDSNAYLYFQTVNSTQIDPNHMDYYPDSLYLYKLAAPIL